MLCGGPSLTGGDSASSHQVTTSGSAKSHQSLVKETSALSCSVPECLMPTPGQTEHSTAFSDLSASANLFMPQQPMVTCVATTSSNCSPTDTPPLFIAYTCQYVVPSVGGDLATLCFGRHRMSSSQAVKPAVVNVQPSVVSSLSSAQPFLPTGPAVIHPAGRAQPLAESSLPLALPTDPSVTPLTRPPAAVSFSGNPSAVTAGVDINTPWNTVSTLPNPSVHNPLPAHEATGVPVGMYFEPHMPRVTTVSTGPVSLPSSSSGPSCSVSMTSSISNPTSTCCNNLHN